MSSLQKSVSLNGCGVCRVLGDFNGSPKGVSSGIADEISHGPFGDYKDTVDDFRGVFDRANGSDVSVSTKY